MCKHWVMHRIPAQYEPGDHFDLNIQERQGAWLKIQRVHRLWTQKELAQRTGLSIASIGNIERGKHGKGPLPKGTIRLLCYALKVSPKTLLDMTEEII